MSMILECSKITTSQCLFKRTRLLKTCSVHQREEAEMKDFLLRNISINDFGGGGTFLGFLLKLFSWFYIVL